MMISVKSVEKCFKVWMRKSYEPECYGYACIASDNARVTNCQPRSPVSGNHVAVKSEHGTDQVIGAVDDLDTKTRIWNTESSGGISANEVVQNQIAIG